MDLDFSLILFWALAVLAVAPGVMILFTRDIVRVAFWLLGSLSGVAGLYVHLGADFLGLTQVLVYIGGVMVLILFGIMMTQRDPSVIEATDVRRRSVLGGIGIALGTFVILAAVITGTGWDQSAGVPGTVPTVRGIGRALLTDYVLPFEIISVLLLLVLCGAAYIARRKEDPHA